MRYTSEREASGNSFIAFVAGITTAVIVGGYYLFGPRGSENRRSVDRWLRRMRFEILDRIEHLEGLTEDQYHKIVDEVTYRQGQLRGLSQEKIGYLRDRLRESWHEMRDAARQARDEAQREMEGGRADELRQDEHHPSPYRPE